jgi:cytochrome c-type biogenesis protein CcmE
MKAKHQRLVLAMVALVALTGSAFLGMSAVKEQASYFYSPTDVAKNGVPEGKFMRLGGMVPKGGIARDADGVTILFTVQDGPNTVPVRFKGIAPALFKEESGVVAEGQFEGKTFVASNLLAKHDENYMPPEAKGKQHASASLKQ